MASIVHDLSNVQRRAHRLCERNAVLHDLKRDDERPPTPLRCPSPPGLSKTPSAATNGAKAPQPKEESEANVED